MSSRIDRYRPEELIGSAGVVDTFRVRIRDTNVPAVLKVLFPDRVEKSVARTIAERFVAAGRHSLTNQPPGSARILEVSDSLETAFVATEFVPGLDLAELVHRDGSAGRVEPALAGLLCAEVADALARSERSKSPLFHLGLCPGNVRVMAEGRVVVLDYGLAAALRTTEGCRQEKWDFVAPEMVGRDALGVSVEAARAADVYSLGLLFSHLLGGHPATRASGELAEQPPLRLPVSGIPQQLASAMRALTASDARGRPDSLRLVVEMLAGGHTSADERQVLLATALRRLASTGLAGSAKPASSVARNAGPAAASPPTSPAPLRRSSTARPTKAASSARWWPARVWVLAGTLLVLAILAWVFVFSRGRPGGVAATRAPKSTVPKVAAETTVAKVVANPRAGIEVETRAITKDGGLAAGPPVVGAEGLAHAQGYLPDPDQKPSRSPNHLFLDTSPSQADVWVDGVLRGKTPVDLATGPGGHRVVAIKPGYLMMRAVFDTTQGEYARRELQPVGLPKTGNAFVDVKCATANKYPVLIDDEETGHLCPAGRLPVVSGKRTVGIFLPSRRAQVAVEVDVPPGAAATTVNLKE